MRLEPKIPFSDAVAYVRFPGQHDRRLILGFIYEDDARLQRDYQRAGQWRHLPRLKALAPTAYLEKTLSGTPYIDFGWRRYPDPAAIKGSPARPYYELRSDRITVRVGGGGVNRGKVINAVDVADGVWLLFHHFASDMSENPESVSKWRRALAAGRLSPRSGTEVIELSGLYIYGQSIRPKEVIA